MTWIKVVEQLPELKPLYDNGPKSATVLVFTGHYVTVGTLEETYAKRNLTWKGSYGRCIRVTHWMPLPDGPEVS